MKSKEQILEEIEVFHREGLDKIKSINNSFPRVPHHQISALYAVKEYMKESCKNYLEIGVLWGSSMGLIMQSSVPCSVYGVDFFKDYNGEKNSTQKVTENLKKCYKEDFEFTLIKGASESEKVTKQVSEIKGGIDLLFIDGDHSTEGVKKDFNAYEKFVNPNGFVVFDDYGFIKSTKDGIDQVLKGNKDYNIIGQLESLKESKKSKNIIFNKENNACFIIQKK